MHLTGVRVFLPLYEVDTTEVYEYGSSFVASFSSSVTVAPHFTHDFNVNVLSVLPL